MSIERIPTTGMSRQDWLAARRQSIGGSDAAAIIGMSPWASPYSVWADKLGKLPDQEETEAMRLGTDLEEYVSQRFERETGKKVRRWPYIVKNSDYPWAHANLDRRVDGESAFLECKTTSTLDIKQFRGVDFPERYYCQCVHYLAVTGYERCYLAVLCYGKGFYIYELERDEDEIQALMASERLFWEAYVEAGCPPPADGSEATTEALQTIYAETKGDTETQLFGRAALLTERKALISQRDAIKARIDEIENTIKEDLGNTERGSCDGWSVSWKSQERRSFRAELLRRDHPEIDLSPYYTTTVSRVFRVKETA